MTQADAEDGNGGTGRGDQLQADTGLVGRAGARRQDDALGAHLHHFSNADLIVAENLTTRTQLAQEVDEVVGKAVVVVDQDQHDLGLGEGCRQGQGGRPQVSFLGVMKRSSRPDPRPILAQLGAWKRITASPAVGNLAASARSVSGSPSPASATASPCMPGSWPTIMTCSIWLSILRRRFKSTVGAAR